VVGKPKKRIIDIFHKIFGHFKNRSIYIWPNMHFKNITYYSQTNIFMPNTQRDALHARPENNVLGHILIQKHVGNSRSNHEEGMDYQVAPLYGG
jgi:hypothetical protein